MLQLTRTAQSGIVVMNAINKVTFVSVTCTGEASFQVAMLVTLASVTPVELSSYSFTADPAGGNIFDQCYAHALTLPEYAGAVVI